ncbi:MAG: hypothetical protein M1825_006260 [Sarcosagium campestre]|nr:MAG: hypothetical protein M1825_006260 [Sarcosagium campestre]
MREARNYLGPGSQLSALSSRLSTDLRWKQTIQSLIHHEFDININVSTVAVRHPWLVLARRLYRQPLCRRGDARAGQALWSRSLTVSGVVRSDGTTTTASLPSDAVAPGRDDKVDSHLSDDPRHRDDPFNTVHFLGLGPLTMFVAHAISGIPSSPSVVLLCQSPSRLRQWREEGETISVTMGDMTDVRRGIRMEIARPLQAQRLRTDTTPNSPISKLIVTTKLNLTADLLSGVKHRLNRDSTICFLQNGMGIQDELNTKLFTDPDTRPNYIVGVASHQLITNNNTAAPRPTHVTLARFGTIALGLQLRERVPGSSTDVTSAASSRHLLRTLTRTACLAAVGFNHAEILQIQLERLARRTIVESLTVIYACRNADLLRNYAARRVIRLALAEISSVVCALPELQGVAPSVARRFSGERLERLVFSFCMRDSTSPLSPSPLTPLTPQIDDTLLDHPSDLDYVNDYFIRRGRELGIQCLTNYTLLQMVKARYTMARNQADDELPMANDEPSIHV